MTECPLEHHAGFPWPQKDSVVNFASLSHAQLSVRGRRVLDRLLRLLPPQLKSQPTSPSTILFSICDALQLDPVEGPAEQNDLSVLPSVLSKLRTWRLLESDHRYSPAGIHKLALDLAAITDEAPASARPDLNRASHARLRVKWVSSDSPRSESQDRKSSPSPPPSPSSSPSSALDSAQPCAHALPDLNKRRPDAGYEICQAGRLGTPDSDGASSAVSSRQRSASGFRSGCSACRHLRLSGPTSTPPSPRKTSVPLKDDNRVNTNITTPHPTSSAQQTPRKPRREKHKASSSQPISRGTHVDENEPPPSKPTTVQQGIGISFPRQRTHSPRISNAILPREPFSPAPASASVQRRPGPRHPVHQAPQGDKRTTSHRLASVDLRLSMAQPRPNHASPNDLHPPNPPTRAQSFSCSPDASHGVGANTKLSSNAFQSRSSKRLPSYPTSTMTTSVTPSAGSVSPTPTTSGRVPHTHLLPLGVWSGPSRTSIPPHLLRDVKHGDRRSKTHKHTSSAPILPFSPASPLIHARQRQV